MPAEQNRAHSQKTVYEIMVEGHLGQHWAEVFEGLTIKLEDGGYTLLSGPVSDQAALFGLLRRMRNAGMTLVSVKRVHSSDTDHPTQNQQI